ncbi:ferrous iron transport protein A [Neisseriaceae bacterium TC5R-5]|nr:ferrous iron transport protein A [Neisseriaceae bacterium TC5R-5]
MRGLDVFPIGCHGIVEQLEMSDEAYRRFAAFGLVPGRHFYLRQGAPFGGPLLLEIGATRFLIRRSLASRVLVRTLA